VEIRYLAIEGPPGAGKTALANRLGDLLDASVVLEETENPFLRDFYADQPGAAFQAQLFALLGRHRQQTAARQVDLFNQCTIADYTFEKDRIYAYLNLDDNELFIYQRLYDLLARDVAQPDLVVYLQAPTELLGKRLRERARADADNDHRIDADYLRQLNEAYNHFFFSYSATPLLVVETSRLDFARRVDDVEDLLKQIKTMPGGMRYYVPRTAS
jgi:deoxyadenosine/deoxycytidine kinase